MPWWAQSYVTVYIPPFSCIDVFFPVLLAIAERMCRSEEMDLRPQFISVEKLHPDGHEQSMECSSAERIWKSGTNAGVATVCGETFRLRFPEQSSLDNHCSTPDVTILTDNYLELFRSVETCWNSRLDSYNSFI